MASFMGENSSIAFCKVALVHDYIVHPTEWWHIGVTGHADGDTIGLRMLLASLNQYEDSEHRHQGMAYRCQHTYYK